MKRNPFTWYVDRYNMVGKSRRKAAFRFSKQSWESLLQYIQWDKEDAVKEALRGPNLQLLKSWAHREIVCEDCANRGWIGGAAMTSWSCKQCSQPKMYGSTAIPQICTACAINLFKCQRCLKSLDDDLEKLYNQPIK